MQRPLTLKTLICFGALLFGGLSANAYEQGSYLILNVVENKSAETIQISQIEVERQLFLKNNSVADTDQTTPAVRSAFLSDLAGGGAKQSNFGDVASDKADTETTLAEDNSGKSVFNESGFNESEFNESEFGAPNTSVFGQ